MLKNAVVYSFCDQYRAADAYLNRANYIDPNDMLVPKVFRGNKKKQHSKRLTDLINILIDKMTDEQRMRPFVKHYLNTVQCPCGFFRMI